MPGGQRYLEQVLVHRGLGWSLNKQKTLKSAGAVMRVFRIWRAISIACDFCRGQYYTKFGITRASNASVIQMRKTHPFRIHGTGGFLLAEALPQSPVVAVCSSAAVRSSIAFVFA